MGQSYGSRRIFLPAITCLDSPKYGHILGKTLCGGPRRWPGRQAHGGTAPCAVPMRLSGIDQHINDEPCAKQRALLGVSSNRYSSVSRGVQSAVPIFLGSPLVPTGGRRCVYMYSVLQCTTPHVCGCAHMMTCVHSRTKFSVTVCLAITV